MGIRVLGARILVKEIVEENKSVIVIPNQKQDPTFRGVVVSVGDGAILDNGDKVPMKVNIGDEVMYTQFAGAPVTVEDETYIMLNERDIILVIEKDEA